MLNVLKKIYELQQSEYDWSRDHKELLKIYEAVMEIASDKKDFIKKSSAIMGGANATNYQMMKKSNG